MRKRSWNIDQLKNAVRASSSVRQVLRRLGLKEAGGNYTQVYKYINENTLSTAHFTGKGWSKGKRGIGKFRIELSEILIKNSTFQSHKLKKRLFQEGIKKPLCEICGWAKQTRDGRIPLELDHINGDRFDNRIVNLRILCPNCHSLQDTHRGKNIKVRWRNRYTRST